jgi:translation initiation factor 2D
MFKKPLDTKQSHPLKNSQRKKLISEIESIYGSRPDIQQVIKSGGESIYGNDNPLVFEWEQKLVPTVYFQWIHAGLPVITTPQLVVKRLLDGADLMVPGIIDYSEFQKDDIVCVCPAGMRTAVCVGVALMNSTDLETVQQGKAVKVLHWYGDALWELGTKIDPEWKPLEEVSEEMGDLTLEADPVLEPISQETHAESTEESSLTHKEVDDLLERKFLEEMVLHTVPIIASQIYSQVIKKEPHCDIKRSSYKKLQKFVKSLDKKGFCTTKEKQGELFITAIHRQHPQFPDVESIPTPKAAPKKAKEIPSMTVEDMYGFPKSGPLNRVLDESGIEIQTLWTRKEIQVMLYRYFDKNELVVPTNKRMIKMDPILFDAIRSKGDTFNELERDAIVLRFCDKLLPFHILTAGESKIVKKGSMEPIKVSVKKRQNRLVTLVWGVEPFGIELEPLMERLKIKCASAATCIRDSCSGRARKDCASDGARIQTKGSLYGTAGIGNSKIGIEPKEYSTGQQIRCRSELNIIACDRWFKVLPKMSKFLEPELLQRIEFEIEKVSMQWIELITGLDVKYKEVPQVD